MNKNSVLIITPLFLGILLVFTGGCVNIKRTPSSQQQEVNNKTQEEASKQSETNKEKSDALSYPTAIVDEEKCGKDAFYVEEKSADFVKNFCRFLEQKGWKLVHQDYQVCEDIESFGGGYNYEKGQDRISVSVIRYGEGATCFWVYVK